MAKSADAFRTISEVAEWMGVQAHVLRFWESKFTQVKPVKRAGGRRYYRPTDMQLLGGIKTLLHDDGMTIKGVQKLLREQGIAHVSSFSRPLETAEADIDDPDVIEGEIVEFQSRAAVTREPASEPAPESASPETMPEVAETEVSPPEPEEVAPPDIEIAASAPQQPGADDQLSAEPPEPVLEFKSAQPETQHVVAEEPQPEATEVSAPTEEAPAAETPTFKTPAEDSQRVEATDGTAATSDTQDSGAAPDNVEAADDDVARLPSFLHRPRPELTDPPPAPEDKAEPALKARMVDAPDPPDENSIQVAPGLLSRLYGAPLPADVDVAELAPIVRDLRAWIDAHARNRPA